MPQSRPTLHGPKSLQFLIRAFLRQRLGSPSSARLIADTTGSTADRVTAALKRMPDTYIMAYGKTNGVRPAALWGVVVPPPDAPRPEKQLKRGCHERH